MAFSACGRLSQICNPTDVGRVRAKSHLRVCASSRPEQTPALNRRAAVLVGLSPLLLGASPAWSAYPELEDARTTGAKEAMESMDQARDDQEDERKRFAFEGYSKLGSDEHKRRAKASYGRLQEDVKQYLDKKWYTRVSNELGLQMANLRYDLDELSKSQDKATRKAARKQSKDVIEALERLNLYAREKDADKAKEAYAEAVQKLGTIVKAYG